MGGAVLQLGGLVGTARHGVIGRGVAQAAVLRHLAQFGAWATVVCLVEFRPGIYTSIPAHPSDQIVSPFLWAFMTST